MKSDFGVNFGSNLRVNLQAYSGDDLGDDFETNFRASLVHESVHALRSVLNHSLYVECRYYVITLSQMIGVFLP